MKGGKSAREGGGRYQREVAEYLGMRNLWPLPGIDITDGRTWGISAKKLGGGFPETVERILEDAEIHTRKKLPEGTGISVIGKNKPKHNLIHDLCMMRLKTLKWILTELEELERLRKHG